MDISPNNLTTPSAKASGPELNGTQKDLIEQDRDLEESRQIGEELGASQVEEPQAQEHKAVKALTLGGNFFKKIGSKTLSVAGFIGISAAALSYILFRVKTLAALIAAPALGAFYIAHSLKQSVKKSEKDVGLISNPAEIVLKAKNDSTYLEKDFKKVLEAMVKIGEMKDKNPKKAQALEDLSKVAKKVQAKATELNAVDKTSNSLLRIKNFMDIYDGIRPDGRQPELDFEDAA